MILLARNNSQCIVNDMVILFSVKHNFHEKSNVTKVTLEVLYFILALSVSCSHADFHL